MLCASDQAVDVFWVGATEWLIQFSLINHKINHFLMTRQGLSKPGFTQNIHQKFKLISSHVLENCNQHYHRC
jgi:hypothetical protein